MTARARLAILAPDLVKGVHAAVATIVPFYLAGALGEPALAWVALGGWFGSLADPGGARRTRAIAAAAFIVVGGAAVAVAQQAAATTPTAAIALGAIVFVASLAPALGSNARGVGTIIALAAAVAASRPGHAADGAWFAAGAAWAALSAALMWPVWPHLPLRVAAGRVFERLADYVDAIAAARPGDWPELARTHQRTVRAAIEDARATALAMRARRSGESAAGANLRVVIGAAEGIFFRLIALAEEIERGGAVPPGLDAAFRAIARDLYTRRAGPAIALAGDAPVVDLTREVAAIASDLDRVPTSPAPPSHVERRQRSRRTVRELRDALSPRGPILVHAVRVAILAAIAVAISRTLTPSHPTWVPVTAIAVLQPYLGATLVRAAARVAGTILGAAIALAIMVVVRSPLALAALLFPLSVAAVVTRPRNYRLFVLFLTPVFVLVTDMRGADWHAAAARVIDVALGGGLALIAALIAPSHERPRLADALDAVLAALARYVELATGEHARDAIVGARREVGLALERAEVSLERMLAEPPQLRHGASDAMFLVTYARRLSASLTEVLENGDAVPPDVVAYLVGTIERVRAHLAGRSPEAALPPPLVPPSLASLVRRAELLAQLATGTS